MRHLSNPPPHVYAGRRFDRHNKRRANLETLAAARTHPDTKVLVMSGLRVPVLMEAEMPCVCWTTVGELGQKLPKDAIYLDHDDGVDLFAADLGDVELVGGMHVELRTVGGLLPIDEAAWLAFARGMFFWHGRHRFCGACGGETEMGPGGHQRRCLHCGLHHFPRSDPAVIVLVTHRHPVLGERCLLGRSPRFPGNMYSTLAGFVEPGESLEQTVRRELFEEVGIDVEGISYRSSQPWPFPASLMLGFHAVARHDRLTIDHDELAAAAWFSRAELIDPSCRSIRLPNADSIARHLIEDWLIGA